MDNSGYEDILKNLEPERIAIINNCVEKIKGKNEMEILSIITQAAKEFTSSGKPMSEDEKKILIGMMRESLSAEQKKKFDIILNMIGLK